MPATSMSGLFPSGSYAMPARTPAWLPATIPLAPSLRTDTAPVCAARQHALSPTTDLLGRLTVPVNVQCRCLTACGPFICVWGRLGQLSAGVTVWLKPLTFRTFPQATRIVRLFQPLTPRGP